MKRFIFNLQVGIMKKQYTEKSTAYIRIDGLYCYLYFYRSGSHMKILN